MERSKKVLLELYERIKADHRHTKVRTFSEDSISARNFPDWGMAYYPMGGESESKSEFEQFKRNLFLLADLSMPTNVTAIFFLETHEAPDFISPAKFIIVYLNIDYREDRGQGGVHLTYSVGQGI